MSETMDLKDVLKSAQTVTSLADDARILTVDSNGNPQGISKGALLNNTYQQCYQPTAVERWHRVVKISNLASSGIVCLSTGLWAGNPQGHVLAVAYSYVSAVGGARIFIKQLLGKELKYRILKKDTDHFIDVLTFCNRQSASVTGIGITSMSVINPETEGYETVVAETTLPAVTGGVKRCTSINCGEPRKGGWHEREDYRTQWRDIGRGREKHSPRSRKYHGLRYRTEERNLQLRQNHSKQTCGSWGLRTCPDVLERFIVRIAVGGGGQSRKAGISLPLGQRWLARLADSVAHGKEVAAA